MNWTHALAFGLGALWILIIFVTASALRSPRRGWVEETPSQSPRSWGDLKAESVSRFYD